MAVADRWPAWGEAAEDWLVAKRVGRRDGDPGHTDRARRADLRRWAGAIRTVTGHDVDGHGQLSDWNSFTSEVGDVEVLLRALDLLADELSVASRARMLSTLRGFCAYLVRRGLLTHDPCLADELVVRTNAAGDVRAFTDDEVEALSAAALTPPPRARSAWPARDAALISTMAWCGLRVSELCALRDDAVDRSGPHPVLRLRRGTKGGRARVVPVPSPTLALIDGYLLERELADRTFIRHDRRPLDQPFIDALLRRCARSVGVPAPDGAMAHGLRHHYGMSLAVRGVPLPIIQQLMGHADPRTTSIYTRAHAGDLAAALFDAGLLG